MAKKAAVEKKDESISSPVKVKGTPLFQIESEKFGDFLKKTSGRNLPHIMLVVNKEGVWVKQGCELKSRFVYGKLDTVDWYYDKEIEIPIGFVDRFRDVVKSFPGRVTVSMDNENLVVQDATKKFIYILVAAEAIKNTTKLDEEMSFMQEDNVFASCEVPIEFLTGISKSFGLTDAKNITISFSDEGVLASVHEKNTHGMEITHPGKPEVLKKEISAVYDGASFKEVVERLNVTSLKLQIVQNANGLKLLGFVESGVSMLFSNYIAPMVGVDKEK
jgi:hypothetical protein